MSTTEHEPDEAPRYRPRRLRRPDEPLEWETTNPTRAPDRFIRRPARRRPELGAGLLSMAA